MKKDLTNKIKRPLYVNVYDELLLQITRGEYPVDSRLPSEPDLAMKLGVSRSTLRQALALLQDDGLIRNIKGKGSFVLESSSKPQANFQLEKLTNPMHKCHIGTFDQIDVQYYMDLGTEYTKQVLKTESSRVVAVERFYSKGNDLVGYAFTFISLETVEELSLDLDNKELLLDFMENQAYVDASHGEMEIKFSQTVNIANRKGNLFGRNNCFLLLESLYSDEDHPIMFNKYYVPQQFANIKLNVTK
jgi:GntR family transcriptional regulator